MQIFWFALLGIGFVVFVAAAVASFRDNKVTLATNSRTLYLEGTEVMKMFADNRPDLVYEEVPRVVKRAFRMERHWTLKLSETASLNIVQAQPNNVFVVTLVTTLSDQVGATKIETPHRQVLLRKSRPGLSYDIFYKCVAEYLTGPLGVDSGSPEAVQHPSPLDPPVSVSTGMSESGSAV
jgi:hypothetical protein